VLLSNAPVDKQQNIDMQAVRLSSSSSDAISSSAPPPALPPPPPPPHGAAAARRRELKPSLMSHISGVHRLSGGADDTSQSAPSHLPKHGVDCADRTQLDEVNILSNFSEC